MAAKLKIDPRKYRPKGGESHEDVLQRALTFIKKVTERLLPPKS
jgi:broad specificity phosphatase PhoE